MDSVRVAYRPQPGISQEQARDARAHAWSFVFRCWQANQMAAESTPEPAYRDRTTLVRCTKEVSHVKQRAY